MPTYWVTPVAFGHDCGSSSFLVFCLSALQLCLLGLGGCVVLLACSVIGESADDRGMLVFYAIQQLIVRSVGSVFSSQGFCEHCFAVHFLQFQSYSVAYLIICVVNSSENQKNVLCENVEFYHYLKSL